MLSLKKTQDRRDFFSLLLKRPLTRDEIVHHIDGDRRNNDPDNLTLLTRSEHRKVHEGKWNSAFVTLADLMFIAGGFAQEDGMAEKRKKAVVKIDVPVALDQEEYDALQRALDTPRKPSVKAIIGYFKDIIDEGIEKMVEDNPAPEEDDDSDSYA